MDDEIAIKHENVFFKTWKKPNIVKIIDNICKKVTFSKLNVKFINIFWIIYIKTQNFGC